MGSAPSPFSVSRAGDVGAIAPCPPPLQVANRKDTSSWHPPDPSHTFPAPLKPPKTPRQPHVGTHPSPVASPGPFRGPLPVTSAAADAVGGAAAAGAAGLPAGLAGRGQVVLLGAAPRLCRAHVAAAQLRAAADAGAEAATSVPRAAGQALQGGGGTRQLEHPAPKIKGKGLWVCLGSQKASPPLPSTIQVQPRSSPPARMCQGGSSRWPLGSPRPLPARFQPYPPTPRAPKGCRRSWGAPLAPRKPAPSTPKSPRGPVPAAGPCRPRRACRPGGSSGCSRRRRGRGGRGRRGAAKARPWPGVLGAVPRVRGRQPPCRWLRSASGPVLCRPLFMPPSPPCLAWGGGGGEGGGGRAGYFFFLVCFVVFYFFSCFLSQISSK